MDKIINVVLAVVISSLVGVIAFNLFAPQADMEMQEPTTAERVNDLLMQVDDQIAMQQDSSAQGTLDAAMKIAQTAGAESPEVARVLVKVGDHQMSKKQRAEAVQSWERALVLFEKTNGVEYAGVKELTVKLADFYNRRDDYDKAETYLRRGLKAAEKASDENDAGKFHRALARVLYKSGKSEEAADSDSKADRLIKEFD